MGYLNQALNNPAQMNSYNTIDISSNNNIIIAV